MQFEFQPVRRAKQRPFWLQQALTAEPAGDATPTAQGEQTTDVCIVGGGYTGLWTALRLKELDPSLSIVLLEADICGSGGSGRNGGLAIGWWDKLGKMIKLYGEEEALRLARESTNAIAEIGAFASQNGLDVHFRQNGLLRTITTPVHRSKWDEGVNTAERHGAGIFQHLTPEEMQARAGSPTFVGGVFDSSGGTIQPALLARGLRKVAMASGIQIFEHSPVTAIDAGSKLTIRTDRGTIRATKIVLAANAWLESFPEIRRSMIIVSSDMVATAAVPDRLREAGWSGGEGVVDARLMVHYLQATKDGRIALGRGSGALAYFGRVGDAFESPGRRFQQIEKGLRFLYPNLADVPIEHTWTGAIDRSRSGTMLFGNLGDHPDIHYALGYSGTGVAPSVVAAKVVASTVLNRQDEWQRSSMNRGAFLDYPPELIKFFGGLFVRSQVFRKEENEQKGESAGPLRSWLASQANPRLPRNLR